MNMKDRFINFIATVRAVCMKVAKLVVKSWLIHLIMLLSLAFIIITRFYIHPLSEPFANAYKIYWITYAFAIAYVSSYIFYILNVFLVEFKKDNSVKPYIASNVNYLIGRCKEVLPAMAREADQDIKNNDITLDLVKEITKKINPRNDSPVSNIDLKPWTWGEYVFILNKDNIDLYINNLLARLVYLDPRLVELISNIQNSLYFLHLQAIRPML